MLSTKRSAMLAGLLATMLALAGLLTPGAGGNTVALAAGCAVMNTNDDGTGSLRAALTDSGCDAITFAPGVTGTITLGSDLPTVTRTVSVTGPGAGRLAIDRNTQGVSGTTFPVGAGGNLTLDGLTMRGAARGVLLVDNARATVTNSTISDNVYGLILGAGREVTVTNSTLSGNSTGVALIFGGTATVTNSTLSGKGPGPGFGTTYGLALAGSSSTATVTNSTIDNYGFGLILNGSGEEMSGGTATVTNSTLSGNATGVGLFFGGTATVTNSTLNDNVSGLYVNNGSAGKATLANTLLANGGNESANCNYSNMSGNPIADNGHNLADDTTCFADGSANGTSHVVTTGLGLATTSPADNGGPTPTIALLPESPAVGAGNNDTCTNAPVGGVDQRGLPRKVGACDIGAHELQARPTALAAVGGNGTYGGGVTLTATLATRPDNTALAGEAVAFALNGAAVCGPTPLTACPVTGSSGAATLTVALPAGVHAGTATGAVCATVGATGGYLGSGPTCGDLVVEPAAAQLALTTADLTRTYDGTPKAVGATTTPAGLTTVTVTYFGIAPTSYPASTTPPTGAGSYTVRARLTNQDYAATDATGTLTVAPATLTVTADSKTKVMGAANPPLTATITGFVNGETLATSGVGGSPTLSTTATTTSGVGPYPIVAAQGSLAATNYQFSFVNGTLTVLYAGAGTCNGAPGHAILPPVNADGSSVFKQGSTVPVKFRVCDATGASIGPPGVVTSFKLVQTITGTTSQTVNEAVDSTTPDTTFRWDPTAQQWSFNLNTKTLQAGTTYVYRLTLNDGSTITFQFGLK